MSIGVVIGFLTSFFRQGLETRFTFNVLHVLKRRNIPIVIQVKCLNTIIDRKNTLRLHIEIMEVDNFSEYLFKSGPFLKLGDEALTIN
jgi:hypothetical protein